MCMDTDTAMDADTEHLFWLNHVAIYAVPYRLT